MIETSPTLPAGHFNDWPLIDKKAFEMVMRVANAFLECGLDPDPIKACHRTARFFQLEGGEQHWLVDSILGSVFGLFYLRSGDFYATAADLLTWGSEGDLRRLGPDAIAWAREIAGNAVNH
jgi:hypothetical protein